ncbi:MAG: hypothetical protein PVJ60_00610 [Phycisphaerales bacterium]|jgi:hypothetical protein
MKIKAVTKIPERWKLMHVTNEEFRALRANAEVDVPDKTANYLIELGFCEPVGKAKGEAIPPPPPKPPPLRKVTEGKKGGDD